MILAIALSYLIGSVPTAYILVKKVKGIDIREHGSGNVGATNVFRVAGKKLGTVVFLLDVLKGFFSSFAIAHFMSSNGNISLSSQITCGVAAISGHTWPVWLGFKGGKGVATSCGVFLGIAPLAVLASLLVWIVLAMTTKFVSVASIAAAITFPLWAYIFYSNIFLVIISIALAGFIVFTHRTNVSRLLQGTELRIGQKKN